MPTLNDFYDMYRVPLGIMGAIAGFTGGFIAARLQNPELDILQILNMYPLPLFFGVWIPFLIVTGVNALNDVFDLPSDIVNERTDRPLVRGVFNVQTIKWTAIGLISLGIIIAACLFSLETLSFVIFFALLGISYDIGILGTNAKGLLGPLKKEGFIGNLVVAAAYAAPYALGAFAIGVSELEALYTLVCMIALSFSGGLGREIIKDIMDVEGDKEQGYKSLAILLGKKKAAWIGASFIIIAIIISPLPLFFRFENNLVYAIAILPMIYFALQTVLTITRDQSLEAGKTCRKLTRMVLWTGAIAFLVGALTLDFFYIG